MDRPTHGSKGNPLVMFDIGAVLLKLTYGRFYDAVERSHNPVPDFRKLYAQLELYDLRGVVSHGGFLQTAKSFIDTKTILSDDQTASLISLSWGEQIDEMVDLKRRLAERGIAVGLLSNMGSFGYPILKRKCPEIFETYSNASPKIYSFELGAVKPEPAIYDAVPKEFDPVIFIDDKESYLTASEPFGWKGIHYTACIDPNEAVRSFKGHTGRISSNTRSASNIDEVVDALNAYGVAFRY